LECWHGLNKIPHLNVDSSHLTSQYCLAFEARKWSQSFRCLCCIRHVLGRHYNQNAVGVGVAQHNLKLFCITLGTCISQQNINGIVVTPGIGQEPIEFFFHSIGQYASQLTSTSNQSVGHQHTRATGIHYDCETRPRWRTRLL